MGYYAIEDETEDLQHHGIRGQKWGVRRFQRKDGTRTPAGKAREREDDNDSSTSTNTSSGHAQNGGHKVNIDKKKVATGLAIAGTVALGAVLIANPGTRNVITNYGKTAISKIKDFPKSDKTKEALKNAGKNVGDRLSKTGNAMLDAALLSTGTIAISKLEKRLDPGEDATEFEKDRSKLLLDTAKAGITTATKANSSSRNNGGGKGGKVGQEVTEKLGAPSNKGVDKQSKEWNDLFTKDMSEETRGTIKALANQGYDIDQLQQYKKEFGHADISEWIHASEFGSYIVS